MERSRQRYGLDLAAVVAELLTDRTTVALPESWQGNHASVRVLENNGFHRISNDDGTATYQLDLAPEIRPSPDN